MQITIENEEAMLQLAGDVARASRPGACIGLQGNLGAGKTTFARGFLRALGFGGPVKSPTYTFVEPYEWGEHIVYHFDLYRLHHPRELHTIGIEEYCHSHALCLIEWPEKGGAFVSLDVLIQFILTAEKRSLTFQANTDAGRALLQSLKFN